MMDTRRFAEAIMRAEAEEARQACERAYADYARELTLAQAERNRRPLRKAWKRKSIGPAALAKGE